MARRPAMVPILAAGRGTLPTREVTEGNLGPSWIVWDLGFIGMTDETRRADDIELELVFGFGFEPEEDESMYIAARSESEISGNSSSYSSFFSMPAPRHDFSRSFSFSFDDDLATDFSFDPFEVAGDEDPSTFAHAAFSASLELEVTLDDDWKRGGGGGGISTISSSSHHATISEISAS